MDPTPTTTIEKVATSHINLIPMITIKQTDPIHDNYVHTMKNKTVFVACDSSNLKKIKKIISQTRTNKLKIIPKFGLQFFYSIQGRKFLENIKNDHNKASRQLGLGRLTSFNKS